MCPSASWLKLAFSLVALSLLRFLILNYITSYNNKQLIYSLPENSSLEIFDLSVFADRNPTLLFLCQSNMKSLECELHCPVCKDIVKQPVVLPCQHSVCLLCASEVLVASGYPLPELPPEPNSPASTPNTRSPRQARRPTPKAEQRPIDRVLRAGLDPRSSFWFQSSGLTLPLISDIEQHSTYMLGKEIFLC